jgi:hypothetical protein
MVISRWRKAVLKEEDYQKAIRRAEGGDNRAITVTSGLGAGYAAMPSSMS